MCKCYIEKNQLQSNSKLESDMMVSKIVENLRRRAIKTFMDMLIFAELQVKPLSGYDIIGPFTKDSMSW